MKFQGKEIHQLAWHRPVIWVGIVGTIWSICGTGIGLAVVISSLVSYGLAASHVLYPWRPEE